jgi:hypothetical protein
MSKDKLYESLKNWRIYTAGTESLDSYCGNLIRKATKKTLVNAIWEFIDNHDLGKDEIEYFYNQLIFCLR